MCYIPLDNIFLKFSFITFFKKTSHFHMNISVVYCSISIFSLMNNLSAISDSIVALIFSRLDRIRILIVATFSLIFLKSQSSEIQNVIHSVSILRALEQMLYFIHIFFKKYNASKLYIEVSILSSN